MEISEFVASCSACKIELAEDEIWSEYGGERTCPLCYQQVDDHLLGDNPHADYYEYEDEWSSYGEEDYLYENDRDLYGPLVIDWEIEDPENDLFTCCGRTSKEGCGCDFSSETEPLLFGEALEKYLKYIDSTIYEYSKFTPCGDCAFQWTGECTPIRNLVHDVYVKVSTSQDAGNIEYVSTGLIDGCPMYSVSQNDKIYRKIMYYND